MQLETDPQEWAKNMQAIGKTLPQIFEKCGQPVPEWAKENGWEKLLNSENSPKIGATPEKWTDIEYLEHFAKNLKACMQNLQTIVDETDEWVNIYGHHIDAIKAKGKIGNAIAMEWSEDEYDEGWICPICKDKRTWQVLDEYKGEYCPYCGQHLTLPKTMFADGYC